LATTFSISFGFTVSFSFCLTCSIFTRLTVGFSFLSSSFFGFTLFFRFTGRIFRLLALLLF
jgi:hypothetical protein